MKKSIYILALLSLLTSSTFAQKIAYINSEEIMSKIPEYAEAQAEIDRVTKDWQQELETKYADIERMYKEYSAQEVILPEEVKKQKQEAIFKAEREAKEFRESKFGYHGALFSIQESKLNPIQDKIFKAVAKIAKKRKFGMVYDKAGDVTWIYTNPIYDLSNDVIEEMGLQTDKDAKTGGSKD